jgi:hypothetical protein
MSTAGEQSVPGNERAETYLRLQIETELRTALGFPRYRTPRQRRPLASARLLSGIGRGRRSVNTYRSRATTRALGRTRSARAQSMATQGRGLLQRLVSRIWQPVAPRWHQAVFGFWRFRAHARARLRRFRPEEASPPADACLERLTGLATAFASAGAVDEDTVESLVADLRTALAARGLIDRDQLLTRMGFGHARQKPGAAPRTGSLRAIPVGAMTECTTDDRVGRVYFGALVIDQNSVELTVRATFSPAAGAASIDMTRRHGRHPLMQIFDASSATDDLGGSSYAHFSGGGSDDEWDGTLHFMPVPPSARWLDVTLPGAMPVRVDLTVAPVAYPVTSTPLAADGLAERYVDRVSVELLQSGDVDGLPGGEGGDQAAAVAGLVVCGALTDRAPALRRFATVARRLHLDLPASLAGVRPEALPAEWLAMLDRWDRDDGPTGVVPLTAMLPELDGTQCVITGLRSDQDGARLQVHARGWPAGSRFGAVAVEPFSWSARDDAGCWYTTGEEGGGYTSDGRADMDLRLMPAISPQARSLEIILTGKTSQVSVTIPLDWQEGI